MPIDNLFTGWDGQAVIEWPEWRARLTISATPPLRNLVIYSPADQDFFCIEPVTNITDAFNAADRGEPDTGMIVLEADETAGGIVTYTTAVAD